MYNDYQANYSREYDEGKEYEGLQPFRPVRDIPDDRRMRDERGMRDEREMRDERVMQDDRALRMEIDRIRGELEVLQRALRERESEGEELKRVLRANETANGEMLHTILNSLEAIAARMEEMDEDFSAGIQEVKAGIHDDMDEFNLPVESKCQSIEDRIISLQDHLDYAAPVKDQMEELTTQVTANIEEKLGGKSLNQIFNKVSSAMAIGIINMVGTIMIMLLFAFMIFRMM